MKPRAIFWGIAFVVPVALAITLSIRLQRERAVLLSGIAQWGAVLHQHQGSLAETPEPTKSLAGQKAVTEGGLDRSTPGLSPWQRRMLAVQRLAAQLAAENRPRAKSPPPIVEFSPTRPYFRELLGDVSYAKEVTALMKQRAETEMGGLFASLHLAPEAQDKLEDLIAQRDMAEADAASLVGGTGMSPGVAMREARTQIAQEILATFGPDVSDQFLAANNNIRFNLAMDDMATRLSYTSSPMTIQQQGQLVGMLDEALDGGKGNQSRWILPDGVIDQAQGFLAAPQVDVLRQIQAEQKLGIEARPPP